MTLTHNEEHAGWELRYFVEGTGEKLGPAKSGRVEIVRDQVCECRLEAVDAGSTLDTIDRLRGMCWEWIRERDARDFQNVHFQATDF